MSVKLGTLDIQFKVGSADCTVYLGETLIYSGDTPTPPTPTPSGQTPQYAVVPNIQSYTATTYDKVYDMETSKWYMLNNLNQYEEYGLYDTTGSSLSDYTYYDGKLVAIGTTEYQYSGNTWVNVGTYEDTSATYTIDDTDEYKYSGQTLSTTFKIPTADIETLGGWFDMRIYTIDGNELYITSDQYDYGYGEEYGTITSDADYYYYSLPTTQSVVIQSIEYWYSTPIHLFVGSKQISVEYAELEEPYGAVSFSSMTEACNYADVYYGLAAHIANNNYVYTTANTWSSVSSQGNYFKFNALANTKYSFSYKASSGSLYASYDFGYTWVNGSNILKVQSGTSVMLKGDLTLASEGIGTFSSTANFTVEGNAMSLLYGDSFSGETDLTGYDYAFYGLFSQATGLTSAENLSLPATTLSDGCYMNMFYNCTSLTTAPLLPATALNSSCYNQMFRGCTSLTTAPSLPATTLATSCYSNMFLGCTSLTTAPSTLPATTLANNCYIQMFLGCTSLTTAPSLPATTLALGCYNSMFRGCTSLTAAPSLLATTLANTCYNAMFYGCTSLSSITCLATDISATYCTSYWVNGVSANGTFTKSPNMSSWTSGINGIPSGWTVVDAT